MERVKRLLKQGNNLIYNDIKQAREIFGKAKKIANAIEWDQGQLKAELYLVKLNYSAEDFSELLL
jgi:hypothetical protein